MKSLLVLLLLSGSAFGQDVPTAAVQGHVTDATGGAIPGANIDFKGPAARTLKSDSSGKYSLDGLPPGKYSLIILKKGFSPYSDNVVLETGQSVTVDVSLSLAEVEESVTVQSEAPALSVEPDNNAGAIIIKGQDLEALPDDPDEMSEALQALAGPSAGPNGGQIFIDGFTGGSLPPKSSIREIRINANPFSAEYDKLGYGRIEIFTKPGTDTYRGEAQIRFNNQDLNSRDPFAPNKPPYQRAEWGGNLSGPIVAKKASFFVDFEKRDVRDNQVINATVLDSSLNAIPFSEAILTPSHRTTVSPRIDWQISPAHTLSLRYTYAGTDQQNAGVGGFSLPSRGYTTSQTQHTIQLTETSVYGKVINETRLRYFSQSQSQGGAPPPPTLEVLDAFTGGGAPLSLSSNDQKRFEVQNTTSFSLGTHSFHAGFRLRTVTENDLAQQNFAGTVIFTGGFGPEIDGSGNVVLGPDGVPVLVPLTSLDRYARTLFLSGLGFTPDRIRALGGGASQFQISGGNPGASVSQWDLAPFLQDDIKVTPDLVLSVGLRYEVQDNLSSNLNLAPRLGFAWSPGAKGQQAKTVIRGGFGVFYDRFGEDLTLRVHHFNGSNTLQYIVTDPAILNSLAFGLDGSVSGLPSVAELGGSALPQVTWRAAPDLQAPYTLQSSLGLERQLPKNFTVTGTFVLSEGRRQLRSRAINAPLPDGTFPLGAAAGDVYQMESTGRLNQYQAILGVNNRLSTKLTLFFRYFFARAKSDTDGIGTFPANPYDLSTEYGRAGIDVRHRVVLGGSWTGPYGVRFSPFLIASTGRPFNITVGRDLNGDSLFTDRPALVEPGNPRAIETPYGLVDPDPSSGETIIPRNFGDGPGFFVLNLRVSRTIPIGRQPPTDPGGGGPGGPSQLRGRFGGGREGGRDGGGGRGLTFTVSAQNLFNYVNPAAPVGNLTSPFFGRSLANAGGFGFGGGSYAGNRRIEFQARYSF